MTKREAAIVAAYTGMMIGSFSDMQAYVEEILERPVWTHELGDKAVWEEIKAKAKPDFVDITVE